MKEPSEARKRTLIPLDLEAEAGQLAAIFATIILNMRARLARERATGPRNRRTQT